MSDRRGARTTAGAALAGLTAGLMLVGAAPASAHVSIVPAAAEAGSVAELAFRVPTERDDASTTALLIVFPADHPLPVVMVKPHPGWSVRLERGAPQGPVEGAEAEVAEVVRSITWTADSPGAALGPGGYDDFVVQVGVLPDVPRLVFKAVQTYSDGDEVRWIEVASDGAAEPDYPAPVLRLNAATSPAPSPDGAARGTPVAPAGPDPVPRWLSGLALLFAAAATALAGAAWWELRRRDRGPLSAALPG